VICYLELDAVLRLYHTGCAKCQKAARCSDSLLFFAMLRTCGGSTPYKFPYNFFEAFHDKSFGLSNMDCNMIAPPIVLKFKDIICQPKWGAFTYLVRTISHQLTIIRK